MSTVLLIDNYDSFTYNLAQSLWGLSLRVETRRNDEFSISDIMQMNPDYIVISPGPGRPQDAGISMEAIGTFAGKVPIFGVCLGMQCINEVFGGKTIPSTVPIHGKTVKIVHDGRGIFRDISIPMEVALYHSLMIEVGSKELNVTSKSEHGVPMSLRHRELPVFGVQFHPESFLTPLGNKLMENFIKMNNGQ